MFLTILLSLIMMAGLFLILLAGVGFIQDKRFFTSAPKEVQEAVLPREERFPGAWAIGCGLAVIALIMIIGPVFYGAMDGIRNHFTYMQFFLRFLFMMWSVKLYDIAFFDYYLLCRSHFFTHYYPETAPYLGPHLFGYNWKSHLKEALFLLALSALLAWICTLL